MRTLASRICVLWLQRTNSHGLQKSCGEKETAWPLSKWEGERARESPRETQTPAWTGFYCFSGYITLRMVLIYYAQVCCRWLPFTDNKGKNVANYFKEKDVTDQGEKWLNWLHSILGRFSSDFRKLLWRYAVNIFCHSPGWRSFSKSKSHSSLGTLHAWFPMGKPFHWYGSCVPDLSPHWPFQVGAGIHSPHQAEQFPVDDEKFWVWRTKMAA